MDALNARLSNLRISDGKDSGSDYSDSDVELTAIDIADVEEFFRGMPRNMSLPQLDDYLSELFTDYGLSKTKIRKIIVRRGEFGALLVHQSWYKIAMISGDFPEISIPPHSHTTLILLRRSSDPRPSLWELFSLTKG